MYFHKNNTRSAGAHFFVDQKGEVYKSIPISLTAWSVGGFFTTAHGAGSYYKKCLNANSVSIELCDCATKDPSDAMIKVVKSLVASIQKSCPNAKTIIRHWDVNGKSCPARMAGKDNEKWAKFKKEITSKTSKTFKTTTDNLNLRKGAGADYKIILTIPKGKKVTVISTGSTWYKVKYNGKTGYVNKKYLK